VCENKINETHSTWELACSQKARNKFSQREFGHGWRDRISLRRWSSRDIDRCEWRGAAGDTSDFLRNQLDAAAEFYHVQGSAAEPQVLSQREWHSGNRLQEQFFHSSFKRRYWRDIIACRIRISSRRSNFDTGAVTPWCRAIPAINRAVVEGTSTRSSSYCRVVIVMALSWDFHEGGTVNIDALIRAYVTRNGSLPQGTFRGSRMHLGGFTRSRVYGKFSTGVVFEIEIAFSGLRWTVDERLQNERDSYVTTTRVILRNTKIAWCNLISITLLEYVYVHKDFINKCKFSNILHWRHAWLNRVYTHRHLICTWISRYISMCTTHAIR